MAILRTRRPDQARVDGSGDFRALAAVVVGFDPVRPFAWRTIQVHGDKNRIAICIRDGHPLAERHEVIPIASHHRAVTGVREDALQSLGDIEHVRFLRDALPGSPSPVVTTMPRVDDHRLRQSER